MRDTIIIGNNALDKHEKYKDQYIKNETYWGLGIENEIYLEFENKRVISKDEFLKNHKRERYSVDYFSNYKSNDLEDVFKYLYNIVNNEIELPLMLNSNSFTKTDCNNNSKTLYTKKCEDNPKFNGNTLIETLKSNNKYFENSYQNEWLFDGDTIEFINTKFYNIKLEDVLKEIESSKYEFIKNINETFQKLNIFTEYGKVKIMEHNNPFSIYLTNINNISMFNNGTLHYNITLPTKLNEKGMIENYDKFINDHKKAIKIIQWVEPLIIAVYCSPDPFSSFNDYENKNKFSKSSQRCAISRYIGVGTYDSDIMKTGKILTLPIKDIICNNYDYWWFNKYYEENSYNKLNEIGLDINFNKHYNHGIELRFLDHIHDNKKIYESFEFIIYLMDYILESDFINTFENPIINKIWNNILLNVMKYGKEYILNNEEKECYQKIFKVQLKNNNIVDLYHELYCKLSLKYNCVYKSKDNKYILKHNGLFSSLTLNENSKKSINNDIIHKSKNIFISKINDNQNKKYDEKYIENFYNLEYEDESYFDNISVPSNNEDEIAKNMSKCIPLNVFFSCIKLKK